MEKHGKHGNLLFMSASRIYSKNFNCLLSVCYENNFEDLKGPVKLIKRVKVAHSFLQSVSDQFHVIILSLPM